MQTVSLVMYFGVSMHVFQPLALQRQRNDHISSSCTTYCLTSGGWVKDSHYYYFLIIAILKQESQVVHVALNLLSSQ